MPDIFRGVAFPFQKRNKELPASAVDEELIKHSIIQIIMTQLGSRTMRPTFGSRAMDYIFENDDMIRAEMLKADILLALKWDERILVRTVTLAQEDTTLLINITYVIISIQEERRLSLGLPRAA